MHEKYSFLYILGRGSLHQNVWKPFMISACDKASYSVSHADDTAVRLFSGYWLKVCSETFDLPFHLPVFFFRSLWIQCCMTTSFSTSWRTMWAGSSSMTSAESSSATAPATRSTPPQSWSRSENSLIHSSWARHKKKYLKKVQNLYKSVPQCKMQLSVTPQLFILFSFLKLPGCENWAVKIWSGEERPGNSEVEKDNFTMGGKVMWCGETVAYERSKELLHMQLKLDLFLY